MRVSVVIDCTDPDSLVPFWEAALSYHQVHSLNQFRVLAPEPGEPPGPVLILQQVTEAKSGKNRVHLDVHPADAERHLAMLEARGARRLGGRVDAFGIWWQTVTDPEGNEFCIVADEADPDAQDE